MFNKSTKAFSYNLTEIAFEQNAFLFNARDAWVKVMCASKITG